jgi:hypothetical protein
MKGLRRLAALTTIATGLVAGAANSAPVIDQQNTATAYFSYGIGGSFQLKQAAQIFTAGVDGPLVGLALQIGQSSAYPFADGSLTISIVGTQPGQASHGTGWFNTEIPLPAGESWGSLPGQTLASFTIDAADLPVVQFQFGHVAPMSDMFALPTPIDIVAGEQYAILLEYTGPGVLGWHYSYPWPDENSYDGGRSFYRVAAGYGWTSPNYDLGFQTFVDGVQQIPEPGTLALLAGGVIALGVAVRRRV